MTREYNFKEIEAKWQETWEREKTFRAHDDCDKPKAYYLEFFPYPSGSGLHVGHLKNYVPMDALCRYKSMSGFNVLHPMGWDAFGQPAENEAIKKGRNPRQMVPEYAANYKRTLKLAGCSYDWDREINSSLPDYYKWTQWIFILLYKKGLAYRDTAPINWCPACKTGLANEEVKEGRCWRCDTVVEKRPMPQWFFKITAYADRLLNDLEKLHWTEGMKEMQRDWIGRSEGAQVEFKIQNSELKIQVFTTRPDTLFGATFMVLAPEHPLVEDLTLPGNKAEVEAYIKKTQCETEIERLNTERTKTGAFTGSYAVNPVNGEKIPVWIADYVMMGYGTGAIMAVPAHDQRDFEFARKFGIPVRMVFRSEGGPAGPEEMTQAIPDGGTMVNSGQFDGLPNSKETISKFVKWLEENKKGAGKVNYRLRDWLISRQRYWGAPIPMIHCPKCGVVPVPENQLPVLLPEVENYHPSGTGESPLANIPEFVNIKCPQCHGPAKRETDTMGGFACSSWYFMRFTDPNNDKMFADREKLDKWLPVDIYAGGAEHARSHLLYSRFWTKVLFDEGYLNFTEPFLTLHNQGSLLAYTPGRKPRANENAENEGGEARLVDWIVLKPEEREGFPKDQMVWRWARMSKSKGNVVTPDEIAQKYGADSLRVYEMFMAPFEDDIQWTEEGINGSFRFVNRVWRWITTYQPVYQADWAAKIEQEDHLAVRSVRRKLHQTIKKVTDDMERFQFNTSVAALMELTNEVQDAFPVKEDMPATDHPCLVSEILETMTLLMAPFTPHMSEELWQMLGHKGTTYKAQWPKSDPQVAANEEITLVVQVNGKLRDRITVPADISDEELKKTALNSEQVKKYLVGVNVKKVVVVPKKLVNIVG
ncbi:MAG: leucine--tRNA ligase [Candidatus Edwardsbacteria bacterium RIFOXYD12_FULL_50_11]|nr:MAG: leucine--tRNA ligase [Candidatus Edwardsbacteria bacterium RifOxyC12_full_54_24]OGF08610.1 MAG: leucine--tRNA ligase [Candidatus Edwardsbacteria bacterium RifOxyA12_full_54_48]OGF11254.1 MAG: leucine--tRNA ligase [Candidatus Edwardsbacteria bacterium GWE2_54_12]OGF16804.1 MAG: leucine--tRNA ligase [Candidatus Edwardsbacteria bacterium RIFOXYD12_FULL_50_11]OGJ18068.1 MAG: leucine--tRNA ligase [Candidatus Edwardsbacteria bacterium RifOxyB12_full_52_30]